MPHLPTSWQERKEADLERRVERIQRDHKFQRLRTRKYPENPRGHQRPSVRSHHPFVRAGGRHRGHCRNDRGLG